jgi:hypothetical protein
MNERVLVEAIKIRGGNSNGRPEMLYIFAVRDYTLRGQSNVWRLPKY